MSGPLGWCCQKGWRCVLCDCLCVCVCAGVNVWSEHHTEIFVVQCWHVLVHSSLTTLSLLQTVRCSVGSAFHLISSSRFFRCEHFKMGAGHFPEFAFHIRRTRQEIVRVCHAHTKGNISGTYCVVRHNDNSAVERRLYISNRQSSKYPLARC